MLVNSMITMADIAAEAGVSRATVSLVLNQRASELRISDETRRRILAASEALGYRRNALARAVVTGQSLVLGLLSVSPEAPSSAAILSGALDEAQERGFSIKVLRLHDNVALDAATLQLCVEMRVMGLLVVYLSSAGTAQLRLALRGQRVPVVVVDDADRRQGTGLQVLTDYALGMDEAVAHLQALGHRRLGLLTALPSGGWPIRDRANAFRAALRRRRLTIHEAHIAAATGSPDDVTAAARRLLARADRPTALVAGTDLAGLAVQRAARALGLRMPQRLAVVAFGNPSITAWADPPLTVLAQPFYQMGRAAVVGLIARLPTPGDASRWRDPARVERLPGELLIRASTLPEPSSIVPHEDPPAPRPRVRHAGPAARRAKGAR